MPSDTPEDVPVQLGDVVEAHDVVSDHVIRTPVIPAHGLTDRLDIELRLKTENLQRIGAFKVRGAINAVYRLSEEERARGVVSVSAGNHGIALSYAATLFGSRATIVMPEGASEVKIAAVKRHGGVPVLVDGTKLMPSMEELQRKHGFAFIHPFDHPHVIAGQGTVGKEIVEDHPEFDAVVVPVGGGGLISGIATAVKAMQPGALVIGVEPAGSAAVSESLEAGHPVSLEKFATVADGLNAPWAGPRSFSIIRSLVDRVVQVSDDEIVQALTAILLSCKLLVEPAGAAAIAALLNRKLPELEGKRVVAVLSGGNVDAARLVGFLKAEPQ